MKGSNPNLVNLLHTQFGETIDVDIPSPLKTCRLRDLRPNPSVNYSSVFAVAVERWRRYVSLFPSIITTPRVGSWKLFSYPFSWTLTRVHLQWWPRALRSPTFFSVVSTAPVPSQSSVWNIRTRET